ncbi:MAG: GNAT family N-acetyltransferase [Acidimicrobiales bacterium]
MEIVVRPAAVLDAARITEVHVRAWQLAYRGILSERYLDDLSLQTKERRRRWEGIITAPERPGTVTLVAEVDGEVAGWASHGSNRDSDVTTPQTGEIYGIYIHPDYWRIGAGSELMAAAVDQMAASGLVEATLWVLEDNKRARSFYARHGWRPDGSSDYFERDGLRAVEVRYRRPLAGSRARLAADLPAP